MKAASSLSGAASALAQDKVALVSLAILLTLIAMALLAPWIAPQNPYDPAAIDVLDAELPPAWVAGSDMRFLLGTDTQGRDLLSTILYGLRASLTIGLGAVALQAMLGVLIGTFAGYFGGRLDAALMRLADVQLSFSTLMVAIVLLALLQGMFSTEWYHRYALVSLILVIGVAEWPQYARTVRASALAERKKEYIEAARVLGFGPLRIMFRHLLPNCLSPILVISTLQVANAIIAEAALSFLGLGMPITKPSLGALISSGFETLFSGAWWISALPGLALVLLILAVNLLGDWLRDTLNPRHYRG